MERKALGQIDGGAWRKEKKIIPPPKAKSEPEKVVYNLCKLCAGDGELEGVVLSVEVLDGLKGFVERILR